MPNATTELLGSVPALARYYARYDRRWREWSRAYGRYLRGGPDATPPLPRLIQVLPTDACNLRCHMCNQWGDKSYFRAGTLRPRTMPPDALLGFLDRYRSYGTPFTVNLHGGEPLLWEGVPAYLDYARAHRLDTLITTNGTRLGEHAEALARTSEHVALSVSMDGGEATHDAIRGAGVARRVIEGLTELRRACRALRTPPPKVVINYCLTERNATLADVDAVLDMARAMRAVLVNYAFRFFVTEEAGRRYDELLVRELGAAPTGAWRALVMDERLAGPELERALDRIFARARRTFLKPPPYFVVLPNFITRAQATDYFGDFGATFGLECCFLPSYFARVTSSGDVVYCPSFPDVVPGNVLREDFREVYLNDVSRRLRQRVERGLLPVCNRCCGVHNSLTVRRRVFNERQRPRA